MPISYFGPGWHRWYSDPVHAGWSGDQIPLGVRFSTPVQTDPGAHPASCKMVRGLSWGYNGWGIALATHQYGTKVQGRVELYLYSPSVPLHDLF